MIPYAKALQCYTTAARLNGYADALDDADGRYSSLIHTLKKAASLLEDVWTQHQKAEAAETEQWIRDEQQEALKNERPNATDN